MVDGHVILDDGAGKEIGRYQRAGNYFKAVKAQIPKEDNAGPAPRRRWR